MSLYRMELYKLCHKKVLLMGILAAFVLMMIYFWFGEVGEEIAVVDGKSFSGYKAVQVNREITKQFKGTVTDEKINQIIERYGIPSKLEENMPGWRDGNYLNDFIVLHFTDGNWAQGTIPTRKYTLEESEYGKVCENKGIAPTLDYTKGWRVFLEMLQLGLVLGSVLVFCSISTVFAEEGQTRMLPLIFTTEEGRRKDVIAKISAAFTVVFVIFIGVLLFDFVICGLVYGFDGFSNMTGIVLGEKMLRGVYQWGFPGYLGRVILFGLQGVLLLCAVTLCISARYNSSFASVIISAVCWGIPIMLRMLVSGIITLFLHATPVFLVSYGTIDDVGSLWEVVLMISLFFGVVCVLDGYHKYKTKEA